MHERASFVRASPDTARSSTYTAWFSRTIVEESLWSQSRRVFPTRAWQRATFRRARSRRAEPFCRRASSFCAVRSLACALRARRGASTFVPSDSTAKCVSPRSIPTSCGTRGNGWSGTSTTNEAWYRPAASIVTVTLDGAEGRSRDQRTGTSPTPGSRSRPFGSTRKPGGLGEPDRLGPVRP